MNRQSFLVILCCFSLLGFSCCVNENSDAVCESNERYTVSEDCITKGSTTIISGLGTYKTGKYVTVKAKSGSTISGKRTSGSGSISSTYESGGYACADINDIHGDWTVSAHIPDFTVTVKAGTGGTVSGGGIVEKGSSVNIKASPSSGYSFSGWVLTSGSGSFGNTTTASTSFKPNSNSTVTANFTKDVAQSVKLSINYSTNGIEIDKSPRTTVTLNEKKVTFLGANSQTKSVTFDKGTTVKISVSSNYGYILRVEEVVMDSDKSIDLKVGGL